MYIYEINAIEGNTDILLLFDKEESRVWGMKGVDKLDFWSVNAVTEETMDEFKRFHPGGELLASLMESFLLDMEDPDNFRFFVVHEDHAVDLAGKIEASINTPSEEGDLLIKKYERNNDGTVMHAESEKTGLKKGEEQKVPHKTRRRPRF